MKSFVALHGGQLDISSELQCGTTVTITLPAAEQQPQPQPAAADMNPPGRHPRLTRLVGIMPTAASVLVVACGVLVLAGWIAQQRRPQGDSAPARVPMNPATAICFILLAVALWMLRREGWRTGTWVANACAAVVVTVGMLRLFGYLIGGDARVDELLFRRRLAGNVMAPNTALAFVLTGIALLILDTQTRLRKLRLSQFFLFAVGCISVLALLGYLYRIGALYGVQGVHPDGAEHGAVLRAGRRRHAVRAARTAAGRDAAR